MTIVIGSVIFAALMIFITKAPLAAAMNKLEGGYDNATPRAQQDRLDGFGLRARGAHENSIEAFPLFAIGVLLALWAEASLEQMQILCLAFVVARIAYCVFYWIDQDKLRSTAWFVGVGSSIWLMTLALP